MEKMRPGHKLASYPPTRETSPRNVPYRDTVMQNVPALTSLKAGDGITVPLGIPTAG